MRLLLDTHALLWWFLDDPALSGLARNVIADPESEVVVSAVSAMEITTKFRRGRLPAAASLASGFVSMVEDYGFTALPISLDHASLAGSLAFDHRDPFDRLLISQALIEKLTLVSNERVFDATGVSRLW